MDSRRRLSGKRGLGIISLRAPVLKRGLNGSLLHSTATLLDGCRVHEHDRHGLRLCIESLIHGAISFRKTIFFFRINNAIFCT